MVQEGESCVLSEFRIDETLDLFGQSLLHASLYGKRESTSIEWVVYGNLLSIEITLKGMWCCLLIRRCFFI